MSTKIRRGHQPSFFNFHNTKNQIREMVRAEMRNATLNFIHGLLREEIEFLCGPPFSHKGNDKCQRRGWDPGSVLLEGQRIEVKKPRARKDGKDVELQSYASLQGFDMLQDDVLNHMIRGVSTRDYNGLVDKVDRVLMPPKK